MRYRIYHNNESFTVATLQEVADRVRPGDMVVDYEQLLKHDTFYATAYVAAGTNNTVIGIPCASMGEAEQILKESWPG